MPVQRDVKPSEVSASGDRSSDASYVECSGTPPNVSYAVGTFDDSIFPKLVDPAAKPRALFVIRTEYLRSLFSRLPAVMDRFIVSRQHRAKGLKDYFLGKTSPVVLFGKYETEGRLRSEVEDLLKRAAEANENNIYVLGIPATKEVQREGQRATREVRGFDKFLRHARQMAPVSRQSASIKIPSELRESFWGDSPEAERVREEIIKAAQSPMFCDTPVLILGDTGWGKDIVAEKIHEYGRKQNGAEMQVLNCASVPHDVFESTLYGHVKGAFTGATEDKAGLWEIASEEDSTLFLDEIGDIAFDHQPKLLRALEKNKIRPVGSKDEIDVHARIIAATERDLIRMIGEGTFRPALYYRLARITIRVPKQTSSPRAVRLLATKAWGKVTSDENAVLPPDVVELLTLYPWPGGIRELRNFLEGFLFFIGEHDDPTPAKLREFFRYRYPTSTSFVQKAALHAGPVRGMKKKEQRGPGSDRLTRAWVEDRVKEYKAQLPRYEILAQTLQQILKAVTPDYAPLAVVQTRVRQAGAFAEKIQRTGIREGGTVDLKDSCGARVIVQTTEDVQKMASFFERHFEVHPEGTCRPGAPAPPGAFSFQPVSYVIRLNREQAEKLTSILNIRIPDDALDLWAEVQVRTLLEQAWANISHETNRGNPVGIAGKWAGELAALGELLKAVDQSFSRIQKGCQIYKRDLSTYTSREDLVREIEILQTVLTCDPGNIQVAARAGRLALALGDWDLAIRLMEPHEKSGFQPLLRDLGVVLCQKYKNQAGLAEYDRGQALLQAACAAPGNDPDAFASLAGTWKRRGDLQKARELYLRAHVIDPGDSYPLGCYLEIEMSLNPSSDIVTALRPSIKLAIDRCRDLASAGINLPWAFFDLGKFHLLLGRRKESLSAYSRAIQLSTSSHMIRTSLESLDLIRKAKPEMEDLDEARQLLAAGLCARFPSEIEIQAALREWPAKGIPMAPVVIVTGQIDAAQLETCRLLIKDAFDGLRGTLIPVTGSKELEAAVPTVSPYCEGRVLHAWIDIIRSGIRPENTVVFGFGSGETWAEQCFTALGLGAHVAAVRGLGPAEVPLPSDENWIGTGDVQVVKADAEAIRKVLADVAPAKPRGKTQTRS